MKYRNTRKQGDMGLGAAIAHFTKEGWNVSIPLTDNQPYDLIVDNGDGNLKKVQVKTSSYQRKGRYEVALRTNGGNRSGIGKEKKLNLSELDLLFVTVVGGEQYLIPTKNLSSTTTLVLGPRQAKFKIG